MTRKNAAAVALGRLGGRSRSRAKALAAKKNGRLGGRPKKNRRTRTKMKRSTR